VSAPDILDLLLPDLPPEHRERVRRLTTALRLGAHAGRGVRVADVAVNVAAAREELAEVSRRRRGAALGALVQHHLTAHLDPGAFLPWGAPPQDLDAAWRVLLEDGGDVALPSPGETPLQVAERLFDALGRLDPGGCEARIWGVRMRRAREGPDAGERAGRALLRDAAGHRERRAAVAAVAASQLARGAAGEARAWLREHADLAAADEELAWYLAWCELLVGDEAAARATARGLEPYRGVLPRPLAALRAVRPEWLALLPGREPPARAVGLRPPDGLEDAGDAVPARREIGASVIAGFALGPANEAAPLFVETGPALRDRADAWARSRDGAPADHAAPEHLVVAGARTLVRHAGVSALSGSLSGVLDPRARASALVPVLFGHGALEGEVAGWVALEFPHHLVPEEARLARIARAWRGRILEAAWGRRGVAAEAAPAVPEARRTLDPDDARVRAVRAWIVGLGMKTQRRRWWFFDVGPGGRRLVTEGGGALDEGAEPDGREARPAGRAHAVARAVATGGAIRFDEPSPRLALCAGAASGLALPLRGPRGVVGVLAVESVRRRDFPARDRERLAAAALAFHDAWLATRFAAWHASRFGEEVHVDPEIGCPAAVGDVLAAGRARMPVAIAGPPGSGRRVLARWLALEGGGGSAGIRELDLGAGALAESQPEEAGARDAATWIATRVDRADPDVQAELVARVDASGARLLAVVSGPEGDGASALPNGLHPELARRLSRLVLRVEPLALRRSAIPGLARVLLGRLAAAERLAPAELADDAIALLWRQPWRGNVRELERLLAQVALVHPGARVGADELREAAARARIALVRKIPSRHPARADLESALAVTRCGTGAWNKTRAAGYLGWDPDTLVARMHDLGVG
jgi:hypothetical protein